MYNCFICWLSFLEYNTHSRKDREGCHPHRCKHFFNIMPMFLLFSDTSCISAQWILMSLYPLKHTCCFIILSAISLRELSSSLDYITISSVWYSTTNTPPDLVVPTWLFLVVPTWLFP
jgi:hypothetical protein